jgi:hypothetical protein
MNTYVVTFPAVEKITVEADSPEEAQDKATDLAADYNFGAIKIEVTDLDDATVEED